MALTKLTADLENIQKLSDTPNTTEGLTADELKALWDKAGTDIQDYINDTLTVELDKSIERTYGMASFGPGESNYSTNSVNHGYIDSTNGKTTITISSGKLVRVDLLIGAWYMSNLDYATYFDIGLDGLATKSSSGESPISSASVSGNVSTNGSLRAELNRTFFFTNTGTGSKTFYALWRTSDATATAYIGTYAGCQIIVTEIA